MRPPVNADRIRQLADELARVVRTPLRIYITGGATAVIEGWRDSTIDVDLRFEPELFRYPAIDPAAFRRKVEAVIF